MRAFFARHLAVPPAIADAAPLLWLMLAAVARFLRAERVEAVAVGRYLAPAIARIRQGP
jgi:hypothetical protein